MSAILNRTGSFLWSAATNNCVSRTVGSVYQRTTNCVVGNLLIGSVKENIAECVGYYAAASIASPITAKITSAMLGKLGHLAGWSIALSPCAAAIGLTKDKSYTTMLKTAAVATAVAIPLSQLLPDFLRELGTSIGSSVGSYAGLIVGGTLGGFAAIHLMGSAESLWNKEALPNCYVTKTAQCILGFLVLDMLRAPSSGVPRMILDQMVGSLLYNATDITRLVKSLMDRQALSDVLVSNISVKNLIPEDVARSVATDAINAALADAVVNKAKAKVYGAIDAKIQQAVENQCGPLLGEWVFDFLKHELKKLGQIPLVANQENYLVDLLKQQLKGCVDALLKQQEAHLGVLETTETFLLNVLIRSVNQYMQFVANHPGLPKAALEREFQRTFLSSNLIGLALDNYKTIKKLANITSRLQEETLSPAELLRIFSLIEKEKPFDGQALARSLAEQIQKVEESVIGFSFSPSQPELQKMIDLHAPLIIKLVILNTLQGFWKADEQEMRAFYKNLNQLFWSHYKGRLGAPIVETLQGVVDQQIEHATLN